jgi:glycosyltransferase involved in cell wall biosynthesis
VHRILLLIKGLGRGGAEQLLVNAAPYRDRERFEYEVAYLLPHKDALVGALEAHGLPVTCLGGARGPGWVPRLRSLVQRRGIDLIHTHSPYPAVAARLAMGTRRPRLVHTEHNLWTRYHPLTYWGNASTYSRNDHVFTVSDEVRRTVQYPRALARKRMPEVETLYHGPDLSALDGGGNGVRAEFGIHNSAPIVGTVANFKAHKGHRYLLEAAARITSAVPGTRFVLVGLGPLEQPMKELASDLGLAESIVFAGFRADAPRLMRSFDVFVLPSIHEGLPIALTEAMALGTPPVVTSVGGNPEVVTHERDGLLVPPANPAALSDAVVRLLTEPDLRSRLGDAARRRAADFDIRNTVHRMEEAYEELLS